MLFLFYNCIRQLHAATLLIHMSALNDPTARWAAILTPPPPPPPTTTPPSPSPHPFRILLLVTMYMGVGVEYTNYSQHCVQKLQL